MPNYQVKIRFPDKTMMDISVTAPCYDEAGPEAIKSLPLKKQEGVIVEGVNRTDVVSLSQRSKHEGGG